MKGEFSIVNSETSELIVKICFIINDLKQTFREDLITNEKHCLRCDVQILHQMDAVLASNRMSEFSNKLDDFIKMTDSFLGIYNTSACIFSEKAVVQNILQKLSISLQQLQWKTSLSK